MQLPAAGSMAVQASSKPVPAPTYTQRLLATMLRNSVCSQDVGRYLMKQQDKLRTDGVLCPNQREDLSPVLLIAELPAVWGS